MIGLYAGQDSITGARFQSLGIAIWMNYKHPSHKRGCFISQPKGSTRFGILIFDQTIVWCLVQRREAYLNRF